MILDGSQVNLLIAFIGGIVTFFASCLLPLVPTYLAYLSGITVTKPVNDQHKRLIQREVFLNSLLFVVGFVGVFVLLGAAASSLGKAIALYKPFIEKLGGGFLILMGLFMLGVIKPTWLYKEFKIHLPSKLTKWRKLNSLLVGTTFGFAWTPCIGPVLAVILFWASQAATIWQGIGLLLAYGIGMGLPFVIIGLLFETLTPKLNATARMGRWLQRAAAIIIILTGVLLITGYMQSISLQLLNFLNLRTLAI